MFTQRLFQDITLTILCPHVWAQAHCISGYPPLNYISLTLYYYLPQVWVQAHTSAGAGRSGSKVTVDFSKKGQQI